MLCCVTSLSKNKLRTGGSRTWVVLSKRPLQWAALRQNTLFSEGPFTLFSHPRRLGNQGDERMPTLRKQGPPGPVCPSQEAPPGGGGDSHCDRGKSFPSVQGRDFSGPGFAQRGRTKHPMPMPPCAYVCPAISKARPAIRGKSSSPTLFPPLLVRYQERVGRTPLSWRTGGQLNH